MISEIFMSFAVFVQNWEFTAHNPKSGRLIIFDLTDAIKVTANTSDIDWSQSLADIDRQLYAKYGLSEEEVAFIEGMIKVMG